MKQSQSLVGRRIEEWDRAGWITLDRNLAITSASAGAAEMLGAPVEQLEGTSIFDHYAPSSRAAAQIGWQRLCQSPDGMVRHTPWVRSTVLTDSGRELTIAAAAGDYRDDPAFDGFLLRLDHLSEPFLLDEIHRLSSEGLSLNAAATRVVSLLEGSVPATCFAIFQHVDSTWSLLAKSEPGLSTKHYERLIEAGEHESGDERKARVLFLHSESGQVLGSLVTFAVDAMAASALEDTLVIDASRLLLSRLLEAEQARERLQSVTSTDELTRLLNRRGLIEEFGIHGVATRAAVAYVDIDKFARVNDRHGQDAGDHVLRIVGERLRSSVRRHDAVARVGGDEFVVVLSDTTASAATRLMERVARSLSAAISYAEQTIDITVSVGLAGSRDTADEALNSLQAAEAAMQAAKRSGGNRVVRYDAGVRSDVATRRLTTEQLDEALASGAIHAWFQPIVDLATGRVVGAEALARWHREDGSMSSPDYFIPALEESGMIARLTRKMLTDSLGLLAGVSQSTAGRFRVSVNVSALDFNVSASARRLASAIRRFRLEPSSVVLEISERMQFNDLGMVRDVLQACRAEGVGIALDDFGTGWSSLALLRELPVDYIKVDRSFTAGCIDSSTDRAVLRAALALADELGLGTVVEGVETAAQRDALLEMGYRRAQGYFFHRPMDPVAIRDLVANPRA